MVVGGLTCLTNTLWPRWLPMHGIRGEAMGPKVKIDDGYFQTVLMTRP